MRAVRNERGIALLIVLIVVALLTITVTEFTYSVQIDQHRTRNAMHAMQASLLARSGVNIMEGFLVLDGAEPNRDDVTWYGEEWYLQLQEFCRGLELEESTLIKCVVKDESNKVNINRTKEPRRVTAGQSITPSAVVRTAMKCFFTKANIDLGVIDDLEAYWQQDPQLDGQGRELPVPEFESLEAFASTIGKGRISTAQLAQLRPYLTAVPTQPQARPGQPRTFNRTPGINVNTAPGAVLVAILGDECATNDAVIHVQELQQTGEPIETAQLTEIVNLKAEDGDAQRGLRNATKQLLGVDSNFWRLEASVMTNVDPENPEAGGIGQTLSELVERRKKTASGGRNLGSARQGGLQQAEQPLWTLRTMDWQKEGGARLFHEQPAEDDLHPMNEENEEDLDERTSR